LVVIVDDDIINLAVAKNSLSGHYNVVTAPSGEKLFAILGKVMPSLIVLDIEMPEMDGYDVIKKLKSVEKTAQIPVLFLTAKIDPESEIKGLNLGAVDYITKPFSRDLLIKRIDTQITLEKQRKELIRHNQSLKYEVDMKTRKVLELQGTVLKTVAELVECRDFVTGGHIERTQHFLRMLVDLMIKSGVYSKELLSWDIELLVISSQLHDVGKISIRDGILNKHGKLTANEFEEMKLHTVHGVDILRRIERSASDNEFLYFSQVMAGTHHEKWNGSGYPYGLKGEAIPLQGRLLAMADVYDALTDERPYKKAFSHEKSIGIIEHEVGIHFDPRIAEVFLAHEKDFGANLVKCQLSVDGNDEHRLTLPAAAGANSVWQREYEYEFEKAAEAS